MSLDHVTLTAKELLEGLNVVAVLERGGGARGMPRRVRCWRCPLPLPEHLRERTGEAWKDVLAVERARFTHVVHVRE